MIDLCLNKEHDISPDTAFSLDNLGALLSSMGDNDTARSCYEQALHIQKEVLGLKHPDTALSLNNLGVLCYEEGDLHSAKYYLQQALAIREAILPANHPDTRSTRNSLAFLASLEE